MDIAPLVKDQRGLQRRGWIVQPYVRIPAPGRPRREPRHGTEKVADGIAQPNEQWLWQVSLSSLDLYAPPEAATGAAPEIPQSGIS